jgi:hypothetical protein
VCNEAYVVLCGKKKEKEKKKKKKGSQATWLCYTVIGKCSVLQGCSAKITAVCVCLSGDTAGPGLNEESRQVGEYPE